MLNLGIRQIQILRNLTPHKQQEKPVSEYNKEDFFLIFFLTCDALGDLEQSDLSRDQSCDAASQRDIVTPASRSLCRKDVDLHCFCLHRLPFHQVRVRSIISFTSLMGKGSSLSTKKRDDGQRGSSLSTKKRDNGERGSKRIFKIARRTRKLGPENRTAPFCTILSHFAHFCILLNCNVM